MFKRRNSHSKVFNIDTLIGAGTRVLGDIQFIGGLHVDGRVQGNLVATGELNSASLSISDSGEVEGSVHAPHVILNGRVIGDIVADHRVELGATAKVDGNVYYGLIEMAMGAQINGKLIHYPGAATVDRATSVAGQTAALAGSPGAAATAGNDLG